MKSRSTLTACGLLTGFLIGVWFGQKLPSNHSQPTVHSTVTPFNSDGWQLSTGRQTGPAAVLSSASGPEHRSTSTTAPESHSDVEGQLETTAPSSGPDITYFPEVIVGAAGETTTDSLVPAAQRPGVDSPGQESSPATDEADVWKAELSDLPPAQAEEILRLRKQLGSVASESIGMTFPQAPGSTNAPPGLFPMLADSDARPIPLPEPVLESTTVAQTHAMTDSPPAAELLELAEQHYVENIANARTPGYRRRQIVLLNVSSLRNKGEPGKAVHAGSDTSTDSDDPVSRRETTSVPWISRLDLRQGKFLSTSNPLDLAIDGPGWLQVDRNGKPEYVRAGVLGLNENRELGIRTGPGLLRVQPAIQLPENCRRIIISPSGDVTSVDVNEQHERIGQLIPFEFLNASALIRTEAGTYAESKESGGAMASNLSVRFLQSFLEASNVDQQQEREELDHLRDVAERINRSRGSDASP